MNPDQKIVAVKVVDESGQPIKKDNHYIWQIIEPAELVGIRGTRSLLKAGYSNIEFTDSRILRDANGETYSSQPGRGQPPMDLAEILGKLKDGEIVTDKDGNVGILVSMDRQSDTLTKREAALTSAIIVADTLLAMALEVWDDTPELSKLLVKRAKSVVSPLDDDDNASGNDNEGKEDDTSEKG